MGPLGTGAAASGHGRLDGRPVPRVPVWPWARRRQDCDGSASRSGSSCGPPSVA